MVVVTVVGVLGPGVPAGPEAGVDVDPEPGVEGRLPSDPLSPPATSAGRSQLGPAGVGATFTDVTVAGGAARTGTDVTAPGTLVVDVVEGVAVVGGVEPAAVVAVAPTTGRTVEETSGPTVGGVPIAAGVVTEVVTTRCGLALPVATAAPVAIVAAAAAVATRPRTEPPAEMTDCATGLVAT